jgi:single-stranded-DNA-specific exonuclease
MLISHIANNDRIYIQVDADCDGFTSSAVLINYLNCLFPSFTQNNVIYSFHDKKAHGIVVENIPDNVKLVIAPDASSNEYEIHKMLKDKGVDVLIIDHH